MFEQLFEALGGRPRRAVQHSLTRTLGYLWDQVRPGQVWYSPHTHQQFRGERSRGFNWEATLLEDTEGHGQKVMLKESNFHDALVLVRQPDGSAPWLDTSAVGQVLTALAPGMPVQVVWNHDHTQVQVLPKRWVNRAGMPVNGGWLTWLIHSRLDKNCPEVVARVAKVQAA